LTISMRQTSLQPTGLFFKSIPIFSILYVQLVEPPHKSL
jgi:hypothetical protein